MVDRGAVVQVVGDEMADRVRIGGDDREKFIQLHPLDGLVDQQRFREQSKDGTKSGAHIEDQERYDDDDQVGKKQCGRNIHRRIFPDDHGDDVGAAAGCIFEKEHGSCDRREQDRETELQHDLVRERVRHREQFFKNVQQSGRQYGHICSLQSEVLSEKRKAHHEQKQVDDQVDLRRGEG